MLTVASSYIRVNADLSQELRNRIVPSARAYRLDKLMDALDGHLRGPGVPPKPSTAGESDDGAGGAVEILAGVAMIGGKGAGRKALIEYVMLAGVNDTEECGRQLGKLLKVDDDDDDDRFSPPRC